MPAQIILCTETIVLERDVSKFKPPNLRLTTSKAIDLRSLKSLFAPRIRYDRVIIRATQNKVNKELQKSPRSTSHGHVKGGLFKTSPKSCSTYTISSLSMPNYCSTTPCISEKLTFPPHSKTVQQFIVYKIDCFKLRSSHHSSLKIYHVYYVARNMNENKILTDLEGD